MTPEKTVQNKILSYLKNLEKEGFTHDTVYVIVKNTPEAEEGKNETIIL